MRTLWWTNILPWKDPPFLMGKSTISTGPFSIAFCMFTRGYPPRFKLPPVSSRIFSYTSSAHALVDLECLGDTSVPWWGQLAWRPILGYLYCKKMTIEYDYIYYNIIYSIIYIYLLYYIILYYSILYYIGYVYIYIYILYIIYGDGFIKCFFYINPQSVGDGHSCHPNINCGMTINHIASYAII